MSSWKTYQLHIRLLTLKLIVWAGRRYSSNSYNSDLNNSNNSNNKTVTSSRRSRRSLAEWWKCQVFFKMRVQPKAKRKDPVTWHVSLRAVCHWIIWAWNICKTFGIRDLRDQTVIGTWVLFCSAVSQVNKAEKRGPRNKLWHLQASNPSYTPNEVNTLQKKTRCLMAAWQGQSTDRCWDV